MRNEVLEDLSQLRWNKNYRIWEPFMWKYDCQKICEIGVRSGRNFEKMIKHNPEVAVAIDVWKDDGNTATNDKCYPQEVLDVQYTSFKERMNRHPFVQVYREYSYDAVKRFEDNYFDFVYIDADHTYKGVSRDIADWYPKIRRGGLLLGDDFHDRTTRTGVKFGVVRAVTEFARNNSLNFFVFPRSKWGIIKP